MSQRSIRVNELLKREISELLHTRYQGDTVAITVSGVEVAPDLRSARVYYSVLGGDIARDEAARFFDRFGGEIRRYVGRRVVLKYLPHFRFEYDPSLERGAGILEQIDSLSLDDENPSDDKP